MLNVLMLSDSMLNVVLFIPIVLIMLSVILVSGILSAIM
jgi:hypothetical protein